MNQYLINWLTKKGNTEVKVDGPWMTWIAKDGSNHYAPISALIHEFERGF